MRLSTSRIIPTAVHHAIIFVLLINFFACFNAIELFCAGDRLSPLIVLNGSLSSPILLCSPSLGALMTISSWKGAS